MPFAGQYTDAESGLQYLRARYYDPATGQFLTRDPLEAITQSAYGYVDGDALNATDPLGLICLSAKCLLNDVKHVSGAVQAGADVVAIAAAPIPVVGEVVGGGALVVSEGAGAVGSVAACAHWAVGDGSGGECVRDVAINVGTAGVGRIVAPGTARFGERTFMTAERVTQGAVNLFGDALGWAIGSSSRNAGYLMGQKRPCDHAPAFEDPSPRFTQRWP